MACDDNQGQQISEAHRHSEIIMPQEVVVLGVDNDEIVCELSDPPLSNIVQDAENGGYQVAKLLESVIKNGPENFYEIVVKPTQIVTLQSSYIYATNEQHISTVLKYIH